MRIWSKCIALLAVTSIAVGASRDVGTVAVDGYHNNETKAPLHYRWEATDRGGFSQLAATIRGLGAQLRTITEPVSAERLKDVDVFVMVDPDTKAEAGNPNYISDEEIAALDAWVRDGGRLVMLGNDKGNAEFEHWNRLAARFGVKFLETTYKDKNGVSHGIVAMSPRTVLGTGSSAYLVNTAPLEITNPDAVVWLRGEDSSTLMAYVPHGKGSVVAVGDPWIYNEYIESYDNRAMATRLFSALLKPASVPRRAPALYQEFCASCHGKSLESGMGPSLRGKLQHGSDGQSLIKSIAAGYPDKGMPAWSETLSVAEIGGLAVYLQEQRAGQGQPRAATPQPTVTLSSELHHFRLETVVDGLETPWSIAFLPDQRMLVTERPGRLRIVEKGKLLPQPVEGIPATRDFGQGGLMSTVPHPDYKQNGWIYLSFSDIRKNKDGQDIAMTEIVRGRVQGGKWTDQQVIWRAPDEFYLPGPNHFGGKIAFDGKGYLYFTHGERFVKDQAQDVSRPNGKVHRVHDDGRVPADNPFVKQKGAFPSIWSYGHRNPQGLTFDRRTGVLLETEHGPRGGDELNVIRPGRNYGWPVITYGIDYDGTPISDKTAQTGMEQPVIHWTPSIAVSAIEFYTGNAFSKWTNGLFVASLQQQELRRLTIEGGKVMHQEVILKDIGRLRDVASGPDGYLYLVVNNPGRIVRLIPQKSGA